MTTLSPNETMDAAGFEGGGKPIRLLDLALPIPEGSDERVRALSYLNEAVDHYISEFWDPQDIESRRIKGSLDALVTAARKHVQDGVSLSQATQVFLCFSICLFI